MFTLANKNITILSNNGFKQTEFTSLRTAQLEAEATKMALPQNLCRYYLHCFKKNSSCDL